MWDFYLAGSEAAFRAGDMMVFQLQLTKSQTALPVTRDYIARRRGAFNAARRGRPNRCASPANKSAEINNEISALRFGRQSGGYRAAARRRRVDLLVQGAPTRL